MSTDKTLEIHSASSDETEEIGRKLGQKLKGGEVIELTSDLGGGKTTFVRGIADGMGSKDKVASPTFTISKVYQGKKGRLVHYDFYRLQDPGLMALELAESIDEPDTVIVIEWADIVQGVLPSNRISISIATTSETDRLFTLRMSPGMEYVSPQ